MSNAKQLQHIKRTDVYEQKFLRLASMMVQIVLSLPNVQHSDRA